MVKRLARRNVEVDVAHAVERMAGEAARGQLVRHQHTHKLFLHTGIVGHRDPYHSVFVFVADELVPANPVGGALYLAVRTRLAREQEGAPALGVEARIAAIRQNVIAAEVRSDRLVRVHRHGDRLIAARRVAAPVHP